MSGVKYAFDSTKPVGQRLLGVQVRGDDDKVW